MEDTYFKYPKTFHFPWSKPDPHGNDRVHNNVDHFIGKEIIITEKLDGENTSMYCNKIHARSIDSSYHPSRTWIKGLHARICMNIPEGFRVCGENMQAKHAIYYDKLPTYFFVIGIYDNRNICLSWDETKQIAKTLGLHVVPVLYEGIWNESLVKKCYTGKSMFGDEQEGYVIRLKNSFHYNEFEFNVGKFVRQGHVPGDEHWSKAKYIPNKMIK